MQLDLRGLKYELTDELKVYIERRLRSALERFAARIDRVAARLADVNGPRGGIDKRFQVIVNLTNGGQVIAEGTGHDPFTLAARVARRAGRGVRRRLEHRRVSA